MLGKTRKQNKGAEKKKNKSRRQGEQKHRFHIAIQTNDSDNHSYKRQGLPFDLPIHHFQKKVLILSMIVTTSGLPFSKHYLVPMMPQSLDNRSPNYY
jgi:hypothetical protein